MGARNKTKRRDTNWHYCRGMRGVSVFVAQRTFDGPPLSCCRGQRPGFGDASRLPGTYLANALIPWYESATIWPELLNASGTPTMRRAYSHGSAGDAVRRV